MNVDSIRNEKLILASHKDVAVKGLPYYVGDDVQDLFYSVIHDTLYGEFIGMEGNRYVLQSPLGLKIKGFALYPRDEEYKDLPSIWSFLRVWKSNPCRVFLLQKSEHEFIYCTVSAVNCKRNEIYIDGEYRDWLEIREWLTYDHGVPINYDI